MKKILVALSGGVDSSVAALLLKQAGYDVSGAYMKTWFNEDGSDLFANCPWQQEIDDALAVSKTINIDFQVINLIKDYHKRVVQYMVQGYQNGITPNPDLMCNREIKFGVFLDYALNSGFDAIATGHYCRKIQNTDGSFDILEGLDKNKDQSYFLALVQQQQLKHALFPVGQLQKSSVRQIAQENNLPNANKKDSQGICFLGKIAITDFLKQYISDKPGLIVNLKGQVIGEHKGLHSFTLGQRKGIGVPSNKDFEKYVVVSKNYHSNQLVLAFEHRNTPGLFSSEVSIHNLSFINNAIAQPTNLLGKPRYRDPSQSLHFIPTANSTAQVSFSSKQRALAPGQLLALYQKDKLLGGGFYA